MTVLMQQAVVESLRRKGSPPAGIPRFHGACGGCASKVPSIVRIAIDSHDDDDDECIDSHDDDDDECEQRKVVVLLSLFS
jgi:hypothetical protein